MIVPPRKGPYSFCAFDGVDDRIRMLDLGLAKSLHGKEGLTLAIWAHRLEKVASTQVIANIGNSSGSLGANIYYESATGYGTGVQARANAEASVTITNSLSGIRALPKTWRLLVNVADFSAATLQLWDNTALTGSLQSATFSGPAFDSAAATYSMQIGANGNGATAHLFGGVADIFVYPRALSRAEITSLHGGSVPPGAVCWLVPDAANGRFTDVLNGYHANTIISAPTFIPGGPWS